MPKGDKEALMKYPIGLPPLRYQVIVANALASLDKKIELNNTIILI